jgi:hypothetical protein
MKHLLLSPSWPSDDDYARRECYWHSEPATPLNRLPISGTDITPRPAPNSWAVDDRTASLIRHVGGDIFPFPSHADPSHQSAGIARAAGVGA